ncbi:hypothetical protein [Succinimonas sp.]
MADIKDYSGTDLIKIPDRNYFITAPCYGRICTGKVSAAVRDVPDSGK